MHRVDTPEAVAGLYDDGDPAEPRKATYPDADAMNALQEEIAHVVEQAGIGLVKNTNTQLLDAILRHVTTAPRARLFFYGQL